MKNEDFSFDRYWWEQFEEWTFWIFPHLEQYWEIIGEDYEIIGSGSLAVVISSEEKWLVYKIPYKNCFNKLLDEAKKHEEFYLALRRLKDLQEVPEYIKIPRIRHKLSERQGLYSQEMVRWLTLKSIDIILGTKEFSESKKRELLDTYTDFRLKRFFVEVNKMDQEDFDFTWNCPAIVALEDLEKIGFLTKSKVHAFLEALKRLEMCGYKHHDLHNSNVMIDRQGNIYIIDFWPTKN